MTEADDIQRLVELKFVNSDARLKTTALQVSAASIAPIMAWYGAYYAGDRYAVYADGEKMPKDQNGELAKALRTRITERTDDE